MKNYTSLEQSKRLIAAGLDPNTADMVWTYEDMIEDYFPYIGLVPIQEKDLPCWSVGALIDVLPSAVSNEFGDIFELVIKKYDVSDYSVRYKDCYTAAPVFAVDGEHLVDCLVETLLRLPNEGYIIHQKKSPYIKKNE